MSIGFLDAETRSRTPIHCGTDRYSKDCEAIIWTWAVDDEPVQLWDITSDSRPPAAFRAMLKDDRIPLVAHQSPFDRAVLLHSRNTRANVPLRRWRDTRSQAYAHGLPGSLELLGAVVGLPPEDQKQAEAGHRLIQLFCVPDEHNQWRTPAQYPAEWAEFCRYAVQDTATLREIYKRLPTHNYQMRNLEVWHIDQLINERGFGFDKPLAEAAVRLLEKAKKQNDDTVWGATNGEVQTATQRTKMLAWLEKRYEGEIKNLRAATVREMLEADDLEPGLRLVLETRLDAAKSSGAKFKKGIKLLGERDRMRYTSQFCGAGRTGRDSHKGFQPGNMKRPMLDVMVNGEYRSVPIKAPYIDDVLLPGILSGDALNLPEVFFRPNETCMLALRHVIVAAPGNELICADYSNIESRVLAWLAGEKWKLDAYRSGADLYKLLYSKFFGVPIELVDDNMRQAAKVVELSMGFGGGVGAYVPMSATYNINLDALPAMVLPNADKVHLTIAHTAWRRSLIEGNDFGLEPDVYMAVDVLKQVYRQSNSEINKLRYDLGKAVTDAVRNGTATRIAKCMVWSNGTSLLIQLPDGSRLNYFAPKLHSERYVDPITNKETIREYITYATARGKTWLREKAWAGLFVENIVQAVANRLLRDGIVAVHHDTLKVPAIAAYLATLPEAERTAIVLKIHDELLLDVPVGSYTLERLIHLLINSSPWAAGMPVAAQGWQGPRYGKR